MAENNIIFPIFDNFNKYANDDAQSRSALNILNLSRNNILSRSKQTFNDYTSYLMNAHDKLLPKLRPLLKSTSFISLLDAHGVFVSTNIKPSTCPVEQVLLDELDIPQEYIAGVHFDEYIITNKNIETPNLLTLVAPRIECVRRYRGKHACPEKKYIIDLYKMCVDRTARYSGIIPNVDPHKPIKLELDYIDLFDMIYDIDRSTYFRWKAIVPEDMVPINYYNEWLKGHVPGTPCKFAGFQCYRIYEQILLHYVSYNNYIIIITQIFLKFKFINLFSL